MKNQGGRFRSLGRSGPQVATTLGASSLSQNLQSWPVANGSCKDQGGPVLDAVRVHLVFCGSYWNSASALSTASLVDAMKKLLSSRYMSRLAQYRRIGPGTYDGQSSIPLATRSVFSADDILTIAKGAIGSAQLPTPAPQLLYILFLPPGTTSDDGSLGDHSNAGSASDPIWIAWCFSDGAADATTTIASHELVEACTDPEGTAFQMDPPNATTWNEICDVCEVYDGQVDGVRAQAYWSQLDQACVLPS